MSRGSPGLPSVRLSHSTTANRATISTLAPSTTRSMTAGIGSPKLEAARRGFGEVGTRPPIVMAGLVPAIPLRLARPCLPYRDGRDIRAFTPVFDGLCPAMTTRIECSSSFLGGEDLDQLAAAGVDLRVLAPPLHRDLLELDAALLIVGDHGAGPRAGEKVQVDLPGFVGEALSLRGQQEGREQRRGTGVLRVARNREVVVALLRGIERQQLRDRGALLPPDERVLPGAIHHQRQIFAGGDPLGLAAAHHPGDLARERAHIVDRLP